MYLLLYFIIGIVVAGVFAGLCGADLSGKDGEYILPFILFWPLFLALGLVWAISEFVKHLSNK